MLSRRPGPLATALSSIWRHKAISATCTVAILAILLISPSTGDTSNKPATADRQSTHTAPHTSPKPSQTPSSTTTPTSEPTETLDAAHGTALAALALLDVKGRAPMTGYDRAQFGPEWSDAAGDFSWSRNGCDSRNDVLARDLQRETVEANGCVVTQGVLAYEPYTGARNYWFDRQDGRYETDLDAEHLVALGNAWVTGAQQLTEDERAALANDPDNLLLVNPSLNRSKGDADFATWLPPNKAFHCRYAALQIRVKAKYSLWVTAPEKAAFQRILATCPNEPLDQPEVQAGYAVSEADAQKAAGMHAPTPAPTPAQTQTSAPTHPESAYYENCDAARAAGAAPVLAGDPGYGSHLDRDGDGSACE